MHRSVANVRVRTHFSSRRFSAAFRSLSRCFRYAFLPSRRSLGRARYAETFAPSATHSRVCGSGSSLRCGTTRSDKSLLYSRHGECCILLPLSLFSARVLTSDVCSVGEIAICRCENILLSRLCLRRRRPVVLQILRHRGSKERKRKGIFKTGLHPCFCCSINVSVFFAV